MIMGKHEKFIIWCDKAMAFSLYALIYFLPISIALAETFTGIALFFYLLKRGTMFYGDMKQKSSQGVKIPLWKTGWVFIKAFKPIDNCLNWPITFFLFFSLISVVFSQYRYVSLEGFLGKSLQSAFLYFNFIECMRSKKRMKIFLILFFASCALVCINGLYQSLVGHGFIFGHIYDGRISSSFRHANDFGAYLVIMAPILFCLSFLVDRKKQEDKEPDEFTFLSSPRIRIFLLILFVLVLVCLGLTYSRGAWVGFILSLLLLSLLGMRDRKVFVSFGLLIVIFLFVFYPKMTHERTLIRDIKSSLVRNNRLVYWKRSFRIIKDYPLFGCGLNTYALVEGRYSVGWGGYPHNSYLQMMAETGLMGIGAFFWMLIVLFRDSLRALRRIDIQAYKMLFFGFLTGLSGFLIHSFFDTNFYSVQLGSLLWVIVGVVVALQRTETA